MLELNLLKKKKFIRSFCHNQTINHYWQEKNASSDVKQNTNVIGVLGSIFDQQEVQIPMAYNIPLHLGSLIDNIPKRDYDLSVIPNVHKIFILNFLAHICK